MFLGIAKETMENERRVAALPEHVEKYVKMGFKVLVEAGAGVGSFYADEDYAKKGATIVPDATELFGKSDVVLKVKVPGLNKALGRHEADMLREKSVLVTFIHPAAPTSREAVLKLRDRNVTSFTMDAIPRTSRAQTMDALTSMSTVTGYKSVIMAAGHLTKFVPMIGTAIGAIKPANVLVVGAGVVGLQAIATAKRLGGTVRAVDIRKEAREAAKSLGAKDAGFDVPQEVALGEGGYARALPPEWTEKEKAALAPLVAESDIVVLSALVPSELAPVLVTEEMVKKMPPGAVIVDVSIDQGGNCALTEPGREVLKHRVLVCGLQNIPGSMPVHSTWLYSNNMVRFVENLFKKGPSEPDFDDDIVKATLVTMGREIHHLGTIHAMQKD